MQCNYQSIVTSAMTSFLYHIIARERDLPNTYKTLVWSRWIMHVPKYYIFKLNFLFSLITDVTRCLAPKRTGFCKAALKYWYYNADRQACEEFTYGGCEAGSSPNKFKTRALCQATCQGVTLTNTGEDWWKRIRTSYLIPYLFSLFLKHSCNKNKSQWIIFLHCLALT